jgi:hypothetical protein
MSGINRQLLLYCLGAYIYFLFKETPFFKVDKTGFFQCTKISFVGSM